MRWIRKPNVVGDTRIIRRFLFLPREIRYETRWLEYAEIEQVYESVRAGYNGWADNHWVSREKEYNG